MVFTWWCAYSHNYTQNQQREPGQRHNAPLLLVPKQGALKLPVNALPLTILISASIYSERLHRMTRMWAGHPVIRWPNDKCCLIGDEVWEPTSMYRNIQGFLNFAFSNEVIIENFKNLKQSYLFCYRSLQYWIRIRLSWFT